MVKLEEIDETSNALKNASLSTQADLSAAAEDASMDDLYDRAVARGGFTDKTFEEALSDLSATPLFMKDLSDIKADHGEENVVIEALKALQYEGTKAEVAAGFKESGNECVMEKKWKDAREYYDKGLAVLRTKEDGKWEKPKPDQEEAEMKQRKVLEEQLLVNRARCNLELKNYRSTTLDCGAALQLNPHNVKAHYRSASALFALDKVYEALDVCYRGLKLDSENQPMQQLLQKIQKRSRVKEEQDRKRRAAADRSKKERLMLATTLKERKVKLRGTQTPLDMADAAIRLAPNPLSATSLLEFPTMFLYPMHNQSDFVKAFAEKDAVYQHLSYMLPLPWDTKKEYRESAVDCYMDTSTGGIIKIGKKVPLLEILSKDSVEVVDGLVRIYIVPQALAGQWIDEIKKKKAK